MRESKIQSEVDNLMKQILHHSKQYESEKIVFTDIEALIKFKYQEIIFNHINIIYEKPLFSQNLEVLKNTIIKQLDTKLKKKTVKPKGERPKAPKEPKPELTKEEKDEKRKALLKKKDEKQLNTKQLVKNSISIPILVEIN